MLVWMILKKSANHFLAFKGTDISSLYDRKNDQTNMTGNFDLASLINIIWRFDTDVGSSLKKVSADYNPGDDYVIDLTLV